MINLILVRPAFSSIFLSRQGLENRYCYALSYLLFERSMLRSQRQSQSLQALGWLRPTSAVRILWTWPRRRLPLMIPTGTTIHAWGAITPGMHVIDKLISYIKTCRPAHQRWKATRVLIIDEGEWHIVHICSCDLTASQSIHGGWPPL